MHLINSPEDLRHAPELREPNAELMHAHPAHCAVNLKKELPEGVEPVEIRYLDFINHQHDNCTALLMHTSDGVMRLVLSELGTDPMREMHKAGKALAKFLGAQFAVGPPREWGAKKVNFLLRAFGYAG